MASIAIVASLYPDARLEAANPEKRRGGVVGQGARKALVPRLGLAAPFAQFLMRGHNVAAGHSIGAPLMALIVKPLAAKTEIPRNKDSARLYRRFSAIFGGLR